MLLLIFVVAIILRLVSLNQSLWLDEAISALAAQNNVHTLLFNFAKADFHPPLYYVFLHFWIQFTNTSEVALRIPSVIFGVGLVFTTYLIAKHFYDKKTAHIAAILAATSPILIYYSQEVRMYMAAAFFVSLSFYFFIKALEKDHLVDWFAFIISTVIFLYVDYVPYFMIITYLVCVALVKFKKPFLGKITFFPAFLIICAFLIPWFFIFLSQFYSGLNAIKSSPAWAQILGEATGKNLLLVFDKFIIGRISFENHFYYGLILFIIFSYIAVLFILYLFRLSHKRLMLLIWFITPIILGVILSFFIPVLSYFRFIFCVPPLYIILASAINNVNWSPINRTLLALMLVINLTFTIVYLTNPKFQRENWRAAVNYLHSQITPKSVVLFEMTDPPAPYEYYSKNEIPAAGALNSFNAQGNQFEKKLDLITQGKNQVFLFQYLSGITDPEGLVFASLTKKGFINTKTKDFTGVGFVYEFKK